MTKQWRPQIKDNKIPLYLAIAKSLADDISSGRLQEGFALPTQRDLADEMEVSLGTVTRAYAEAEKRGLIRAEGRRGTFVGPGKGAESSLSSLFKPEPGRIDFGPSFAPRCTDPDLGRVLLKMTKRLDLGEIVRYPTTQGLERHRIAGIRWMEEFLGLQAAPEEIIVTSGGQNSLFIALAALSQPGDTVLTEQFTYPGLKAAAHTLGLRPVGLTMDQQGLLPESLEDACRKTKARILYCTPDLHNPTSAVMSPQRRKLIAKIAREHGLAVLEDTLFRPLLTEQHPLLFDYLPEQTYVLASLAKTVAGGLRVGFIKGPPEDYEILVQTAQAVNMAVSPLPQEVFAIWMEDGTVGEILANRRQESDVRQDLLFKHLGKYKLSTHPISYYALLYMPEHMQASRLIAEAHMRNVIVSPLDLFTIGPGPWPQAVRISLSTPESREMADMGLKILADVLTGVSCELCSTI